MSVGFRAATCVGEEHRLAFLPGSEGEVGCHLRVGWNTIPVERGDEFLSSSWRTLLRLKNISLFRGPVESCDLKKNMIGPTNFLGTLTEIDKKAYTIAINECGLPLFSEGDASAALAAKELQRPDKEEIHSLSKGCWEWKSGKERENRDLIHSFLSDEGINTLTPDPGVMLLDCKEIVLKPFDARSFDLSAFGAKLVKNDEPFTLVAEKEDIMDVVIYRFGEGYANHVVEEGCGLFLETHNFTQIMTPVTPSAGGFITLGKKSEAGELELIGVKVPYGYSIIINKGAIHGDATFTGDYAMAMTVDHTTMRTADVVFLKERESKSNVRIAMPSGDEGHEEAPHNYPELLPISYPYGDSPCKEELREQAWVSIGRIKLPGSARTSIVLDPSSRACWHYGCKKPAGEIESLFWGILKGIFS